MPVLPLSPAAVTGGHVETDGCMPAAVAPNPLCLKCGHRLHELAAISELTSVPSQVPFTEVADVLS